MVYKAKSNLHASFTLAIQRRCINLVPISKCKKPHNKMQLFYLMVNILTDSNKKLGHNPIKKAKSCDILPENLIIRFGRSLIENASHNLDCVESNLGYVLHRSQSSSALVFFCSANQHKPYNPK